MRKPVGTYHDGPPVTALVWHPTRPEFLIGDRDGVVSRWTVGRPTLQETVTRGKSVNVLAVSPDGKRVVSAAEGPTAHVLDWDRLAVTPISLITKASAVRGVAFTADGKRVLVGGLDGKILLFDLAHPDRPATLGQAAGALYALALHPSGKAFVTGDIAGAVELWLWKGVPGVRPTPKRLATRGIWIGGLAFSPDGKWLTGADALGGLQTWALDPSGSPILPSPTWSQQRDNDGIAKIAYAPDSRTLASAIMNGMVRVYDFATPASAPREWSASRRDSPIYSLAISRDGGFVGAIAHEQPPLLWNRKTGDSVPIHPEEEADQPWHTCAAPPTGNAFYIFGGNKGLVINGLTGQIQRSLPFGGTRVAVSRDGSAIATDDLPADGVNGNAVVHIAVYSLTSPDLPPLILGDGPLDPDDPNAPSSSRVTAVAFCPARDLLAVGTDDGLVRLWDMSRPSVPPAVLYGSLSTGFAAVPSEKRKPARGPQGVVTVDLNRIPKPLGGAAQALSFPDDGNSLLVGRGDGSAQMWSFPQGDRGTHLIRAWQAHPYDKPVRAVAISPGRQWLVTGGEDGTVNLWDAADARSQPVTFGTRGVGVYCLGFSPDGSTLFAGNSDNEVVSWLVSSDELAEAVCRKVHRDLRDDEWDRYVGESVPREPVCGGPDR